MTRGQKPTYDVVTPLDVDYLDAFGEATDEEIGRASCRERV